MHVKAANLQIALDWLESIIDNCLKIRFGQTEDFEISPLSFHSRDTWLAAFMAQYEPGMEEFVVLLLSIVPHLQPHFFNKLIAEHLPEGGDFPEFGGVKGSNHRGILPTGETVQFILAGDDLEKRLEIQRILSTEHWFAQKHMLKRRGQVLHSFIYEDGKKTWPGLAFIKVFGMT